MQCGGNLKALQYFAKFGLDVKNIDYKSNQLERYKNELEIKYRLY